MLNTTTANIQEYAGYAYIILFILIISGQNQCTIYSFDVVKSRK